MKKKPGKSGKTHRMPDGSVMKGAKHKGSEYKKPGKKRG